MPDLKESLRQVAIRVAREPMRATLDDVRKLARGFLLLSGGDIPRLAKKRRP
jgi:hypothetical protein